MQDLKGFLDEKTWQYNRPEFIESDPVQIPHLFQNKEDQEISGFLSATIAWGNRTMILKNAHKMMQLMGNAPYDFVMSHTPEQLDVLQTFVHRTFNGHDFKTFVTGLKHIYTHHGGMEAVFSKPINQKSIQPNIAHFKELFFEIEHQTRTEKHISNPMEGSAAKRINLFLRWMVRNDKAGVDLGKWTKISPSILSCPLDVHSGNVARKLGLLDRKQNDAKAVNELDTNLRFLDPIDPVKYDFALFGLGVFEGF
jgi:uncharacterized protein (TIGR02757 family)